MATGTPVVGFRRGSVPGIIADGETRYVVDDLDAMVEAVQRVGTISPAACRRVEACFATATMTDGYLALAARLL